MATTADTRIATVNAPLGVDLASIQRLVEEVNVGLDEAFQRGAAAQARVAALEVASASADRKRKTNSLDFNGRDHRTDHPIHAPAVFLGGPRTRQANEAITRQEAESLSAAAVSGGAPPVDAEYLTLSANGTLSNERVFTAGFALTGTDAGAGSTYTLAVTDAELVALAGLTSAADKLPYFTGSGTAALTDITAFARTLIDDTDAATARATLGLIIGTNVQAWDLDLDTIAGLAPSNDDIIQRKAGAWASRTIAQYKADLGLSGTNSGDVTLAGTPDYITISAQVITRALINLTTHVTGTLPVANGGTGNTSGTATTNANLTGPITSVGNATSVASQTGTGSTFVMQASPTLTTPVIGVASGTSLTLTNSGPSSIVVKELAAASTYMAAWLNGLTAPSEANFYSSTTDTNFYLNTPTTKSIVLRVAAASKVALDATSWAPSSAGLIDLGKVASGYASLYLDEAGAGTQTAQIIAPTLASDIVLTTPAATGTLATLAGSEALSNKTYAGSTATLTGLAKASSLNLTLGGTELPLATDEVAMFTSRAAASNDAYVAINSGTSGSQGIRFYDNGTLGSEIASGTLGGVRGGHILQLVPDGDFSDSFLILDMDTFGDFVQISDYNGDSQFKVNGGAAAAPNTIEIRGKINPYNNIATVEGGVPAIRAQINATGQTAQLSTTTVYAVPATPGTGYFRIGWYIERTTAATSTSSLTPVITVTGGDSNVAQTITLAANTTNSATTGALVGSEIIYARTGTNIRFGIAYASSGATAMVYNYRVLVEAL